VVMRLVIGVMSGWMRGKALAVPPGFGGTLPIVLPRGNPGC
jgi:hypothetical protein